MNEHPTDLLPAFVLGALDDEDARHVAHHLRTCAPCRAEAESFRAVVDLLPYSASAHEPPAHIKRQIFARIAATHAHHADGAPILSPANARLHHAPPRTSRWVYMMVASAIALTLLLSVTIVGTHHRLAEAEVALQHSERQRSQQQQIVTFLSNPQATPHALTPHQTGATGHLITHAGEPRAVLVVHGLPQPDAQHRYQLWLADAQHTVPLRAFSVAPDGSAEFLFEAPAPLDHYTQTMITLEPVQGDDAPRGPVVLSTPL